MSVELIFRVWDGPGRPKRYKMPPGVKDDDDRTSVFLLANESWNDYSYFTSFILHVSVRGSWLEMGSLSIGYRGQREGDHTYEHLGRPERLLRLPPEYFSLGESIDYYGSLLATLGEDRARAVLVALRDSAVGLKEPARIRARNQAVFAASLLRTNSALEAWEQAPALFGGDAHGYQNAFTATIHVQGADAPHVFEFDFSEQTVPSRISVLVGLNGTGKTQSMAALARLLSRLHESEDKRIGGTYDLDDRSAVEPRPSIYGVVAVSFSAFDDFVIPSEAESDDFKYVYCGLDSIARGRVGSRTEIVDAEVAARFERLDEPQRLRVLSPLRPTLDPEFNWNAAAIRKSLPLARLSAGQRIVLSVASELMQNVSNRVLVLMDEPEIHLHPQLLSGLLAWTDDLLAENDSFALVATHSPIVVQQALSSSVFVLRRSGTHPSVGHPAIETFGANLTEIVREVFEDRAGDRSYQDALRKLWQEHGNVEAVIEQFDGRLGLNAEIFLRSLERQ